MTEHIQTWITHPEQLNRETLYELRTLLARYPYFQTARLLYLKNLYLLHDADFGNELRKAALYVNDRRVLFYLIEGDRFAIRPTSKQTFVVPKEEPTLDRTLQLIDSFLATMPQELAPATTEYNLSADYMTYMLREEELAEQTESDQTPIPLRGQSLIDDFIVKAGEGFNLRITPEKESAIEENFNDLPHEDDSAESEEEDGYFTETLAKIYIKQQRYSKALEIIRKLSLKYPKKNAYFADQIRFLEKLIINTQSK